MSQCTTSLFDYHTPTQKDCSLAVRVQMLSPDRGSFQYRLDDLKNTQKYRDVRPTQSYYSGEPIPKRPTRLYPPRRNGFVYEDIYSKRARWAEYKSKYDYSSPYKPIRSEFLTLPSHILANKYSTLPKSWSISSSNSYKNHFAPIHSASTTTDLTFSPAYNYYRQTRPAPQRDPMQTLRYIKYFSDERNFEDPKPYNDIQESVSYKRSVRRQSVGDVIPWYGDLESTRVQRARKLRPEQRVYAHREIFYQQDKSLKQQRIVTQQQMLDNASLTRSNNLAGRRNEYEVKKNVTFSEVSGCEVSKNGSGKQAVYVRELEVSFSQVADKCNIGMDYKLNPTITEGKNKSTPNGHCLIGSGVESARSAPAGKLPLKPGQTTGLLSSFTKRKYLSQVRLQRMLSKIKQF